MTLDPDFAHKGIPVKALLKALDFALTRQCSLQEMQGALFLIDTQTAAKCSISSNALQAGLSNGLFRIEQGGTLQILPEAKAFIQRHRDTPLKADYAAQHQDLKSASIFYDGERVTAVRNRKSSNLSQLERMRSLDGQAYFSQELIAAAERLSQDFEKAQPQPRISSRWEPKLEVGSGSMRNHAADISDFAANAHQRFTRAISAVGPELSGVVIDAICFEKGLELIERERQWPARSAKLMLRTGLEILFRHYQPPARTSAPIRNWQPRA